MEPARLEANRPAGHEQAPAVMYSSGKPGYCRLSLTARQMVVQMHILSPKQEWMRPWISGLKVGVGGHTRFQSPKGNTPGLCHVFSEEAFLSTRPHGTN